MKSDNHHDDDAESKDRQSHTLRWLDDWTHQVLTFSYCQILENWIGTFLFGKKLLPAIACISGGPKFLRYAKQFTEIISVSRFFEELQLSYRLKTMFLSNSKFSKGSEVNHKLMLMLIIDYPLTRDTEVERRRCWRLQKGTKTVAFGKALYFSTTTMFCAWLHTFLLLSQIQLHLQKVRIGTKSIRVWKPWKSVRWWTILQRSFFCTEVTVQGNQWT